MVLASALAEDAHERVRPRRIGDQVERLLEQRLGPLELAAIEARLAAASSSTAGAATTVAGIARLGSGSRIGVPRAITSATTRRRASGVIGLVRKSIAPSFIAATASGMLPCAVRITTGTTLPACPQPAEQLHAVHPGHLEVEQDQVVTADRSSWSSASCPSAASTTT